MEWKMENFFFGVPRSLEAVKRKWFKKTLKSSKNTSIITSILRVAYKTEKSNVYMVVAYKCIKTSITSMNYPLERH